MSTNGSSTEAKTNGFTDITSETIGRSGLNAGKIWCYLKSHGESSPARLAKDLKISEKEVHRSLGWLAREDRLAFYQAQRGEVVKLK